MRERLTALVRSHHYDLLVTAGRVACPIGQGDVDVDACFACRSFEGMADDNAIGTWLRCRAARNRPTLA